MGPDEHTQSFRSRFIRSISAHGGRAIPCSILQLFDLGVGIRHSSCSCLFAGLRARKSAILSFFRPGRDFLAFCSNSWISCFCAPRRRGGVSPGGGCGHNPPPQHPGEPGGELVTPWVFAYGGCFTTKNRGPSISSLIRLRRAKLPYKSALRFIFNIRNHSKKKKVERRKTTGDPAVYV